MRALPRCAVGLFAVGLVVIIISNLRAEADPRVTTGVLAISRSAENRLPPVAAVGETFTSFTLEPGVRVTLQQSAGDDRESTFARSQPPHVVFYLLPNGNTTEQALGRTVGDGVGWRYGIQHVAAQTRRVRELLAPRRVLTAVVEADTLSWPAWRRVTPEADARIVEMVEKVISRAAAGLDSGTSVSFDLVAHSGGGSFILGYINAWDELPGNLEHISFIDANYSYSDEDGHGDKLLRWLKASERHRLVVMAYDDRRVMIDGKPIVSETGGTWRATDRMARRLERDMEFAGGRVNDLETSTALEGRVVLARHPNSDNKILHTVLVEKNGFVYSVAGGRTQLGKDDQPYGKKEAYRERILP